MVGIFEIKPQGLKQVENEFNDAQRTIQQCMNRLESVRSQLNGGTYGEIKSAIRSIENECEKELASIKSLKRSLNEIVRSYENAEKRITGERVSYTKSGQFSSDDGSEKGESVLSEFKDNLVQALFNSMLESGGNTLVRIGGLVNVVTSVARGTGENAFVIVNPNVINTTSKMIKGGQWIATGAKWGLPVIGGIIDFATQVSSGEGVKDAAIKAGVHTGVGVAVGAAIGSIIPGPGTIAGAAVGLVVGTAVTFVTNKAFDFVYDNWDDIKEFASETWEDVKETASEAWEDVKETASEAWEDVKETASEAWEGAKETASQMWDSATSVISNAADNVGNAVKGFFGNLGTVFG